MQNLSKFAKTFHDVFYLFTYFTKSELLEMVLMLNSDLELLSATGFYFLLPFNFAIYHSVAGILR